MGFDDWFKQRGHHNDHGYYGNRHDHHGHHGGLEPESANLFWLDYALSDSVTILPSLSPRGAEITPAPWLLKKVTLYFGFRIVFSPF